MGSNITGMMVIVAVTIKVTITKTIDGIAFINPKNMVIGTTTGSWRITRKTMIREL